MLSGHGQYIARTASSERARQRSAWRVSAPDSIQGTVLVLEGDSVSTAGVALSEALRGCVSDAFASFISTESHTRYCP